MAEFKHIIRIASTDLKGEKPILFALKKIKGVSVMFANAACSIANINKKEKAGNLTAAEADKLTEVLSNPSKYGIPEWMYNRKKDPETGTDTHIIGPELKFTQENDMKMMKKVKSYKGLRHQWGLPVRGQRTQSNFRRNKGKGSLGVKRKR